ncbi:hypothetical protein [Terrisporobacter sp.]
MDQYRNAKKQFEEKYGAGNFDCYYDVFLNLRNSENLKRLKQIYGEEDHFKSGYQRKNHSNYKDNSKKSSYQERSSSN